MNKIIYKADTRGSADYGWLKTHYSFSFANYHDSKRVHFGLLRVLNDDEIAGGEGFGTHPHDNMEIVTIPIEGALAHKDSMGTNGIIKAGEIQVMSAGSGITHSEFNASKTEPLKLFQIWVFPEKRDIEPRYDQKQFNYAEMKNKFKVVVSPQKEGNHLWINQDAYFSLGKFDSGSSAVYKMNDDKNGAFVFLIEGSSEIAGEKLERRDAIGITGVSEIEMKFKNSCHVLVIEVPMS